MIKDVPAAIVAVQIYHNKVSLHMWDSLKTIKRVEVTILFLKQCLTTTAYKRVVKDSTPSKLGKYDRHAHFDSSTFYKI